MISRFSPSDHERRRRPEPFVSMIALVDTIHLTSCCQPASASPKSGNTGRRPSPEAYGSDVDRNAKISMDLCGKSPYICNAGAESAVLGREWIIGTDGFKRCSPAA